MNRFKKEEKRQKEEMRKGLNPEQVRELDSQEVQHKATIELAKRIHIEKFSEEYDFMCDSTADANDRQQGKNPMSTEYIARVEEKRKNLGVSVLSKNGMPTAQDTWELCIQEAKKQGQ